MQLCTWTYVDGTGRLQTVFPQTKPSGQPQRCLEVTRARECFGFEARMLLQEGLQRMVDWYTQSLKEQESSG